MSGTFDSAPATFVLKPRVAGGKRCVSADHVPTAAWSSLGRSGCARPLHRRIREGVDPRRCQVHSFAFCDRAFSDPRVVERGAVRPPTTSRPRTVGRDGPGG
ncbi:hypothetical protein PSMK_06650 [Phycisphaera mikurensis NBRC 102666]|uniref:Uncharacterized protein n=1 Tax=Phycisphaera mikurensis (strain NBRC 102666 / KCTC 22515 / FYK2301M01) TaxID=1142394 RepID=I0IC36_PHYMF|nr:hypothetical protein PSMK_06650 [Phycisphaera mikurensis NBRC 102666]